MPNECKNIITIEGNGYKEFIEKNTNKSDKMLNLELGVPINSNLREPANRYWGSFILTNSYMEWEEDNKFVCYTAWRPIRNYVITVSKKYPKLTFSLDYEEFSMGIYGNLVVKAGNILLDNKCFHTYMSKVYNIKNIPDVLKLIENTYGLDIDALDNDNIWDDDWNLGNFLSNTNIDVEKEWKKYVKNNGKILEDYDENLPKMVCNNIYNNFQDDVYRMDPGQMLASILGHIPNNKF